MSACCGSFGWGSTASGSPSRSQASDGAPQGLLRLRVDASQRPKVLAVPGTRLALIPRPAAAENRVWLVEGPSDMLAARSAGLPAIAVPGTHAWRAEWAGELAGRRVTVVMDADRPGRQAAVRIAGDLERHGAADVRILELAPTRDDGYDLSDWLREGNQVRTLTARTLTSDEYRRIARQRRPIIARGVRRALPGARVGDHEPGCRPRCRAAAARSYGCARFDRRVRTSGCFQSVPSSC